jgi:hypothetical protein
MIYMSCEVLKAVNMAMTVSWDVTIVVWYRITNVLEELLSPSSGRRAQSQR